MIAEGVAVRHPLGLTIVSARLLQLLLSAFPSTCTLWGWDWDQEPPRRQVSSRVPVDTRGQLPVRVSRPASSVIQPTSGLGRFAIWARNANRTGCLIFEKVVGVDEQ
jgi:hypothetical protein